MTGHLARTGLVVALACTTLTGAMQPSYADDRGGAIAAGVIGGAALGALAAGAAGAYAPPPPPVYVQPAYAPPPPPPRCHRELVRYWDEYEQAYIERPRRVCDPY